tara:strand:- start:2746 stop:3345 length:600 start_codon:yes stop_codon:yes gene_type:complete
MIKWLSAFVLSILIHFLIFLIYSFLDSIEESEVDRKITNVSFIESIDIEQNAPEVPVENTNDEEILEEIPSPIEPKTEIKETKIENLDQYLSEEKEQESQDEVQDLVNKISAQVINDIESIWIRPNNISEGMYADFSLSLDRLGNINSFNILRSSGSDVFDRAAMNAIKKYKKIKYIKDIDDEMYRIYFANFTLRFKPK